MLYSISAAASRGCRRYMEDRVVIELMRDENKEIDGIFVAVLDGHGGPEASSYVKEHLWPILQSTPGFESTDSEAVLKAMKATFLQIHEEMKDVHVSWPSRANGFPSTAGTTVSCALIRHGKIYTAHCGDSRIVLVRETSMGFSHTDLTADHKPEDHKELARIERDGGSVSPSLRFYAVRATPPLIMLLSRQTQLLVAKVAPSLAQTAQLSSADYSTNLKEVLAKKIPAHNKDVAAFRKEHGGDVIQKITIDMVYGGMRSMKGMVTETSVLDPEEGIRFRGYSIPECQELLPKAAGGQEPLPEAIWWLLCTGEIPDQKQVEAISKEWAQRAELPEHVVTTLNNFPAHLHPMAQFTAAIAALQSESKFAQAYAKGVHKTTYWEHTYEDAMNLLAKLPTVAATIYKNIYRDGVAVAPIDPKLDWSANFANQLGYNDPQFVELLRLYLVIHSDHEGGNVSAHTSHLVGSALSDSYYSFAAAMAGLAGPLHGLANQEVLIFLKKLIQEVGEDYNEQKLKDWIWNHLKSGQVVPGYGHAVLRKTDPRYTCQREFALKHLPNDKMFKLVSDVYKVTPDILLEQGKAKNPWPNVDAHSGVLLQHYGLTEMNYYTVLFGVSRALGCLSQLIWARGMGLPLERPKSHSTEGLKKLVKAA